MRHYTKCDACKKEGTPEWTPHMGIQAQMMQAGSGYWKPPAGWAEHGGFLLCGDCHGKVHAFVSSLVGQPWFPHT